MSVLVNVEAHFHTVEVDGAVVVAVLAQLFCEFVEGENFVGKVAFSGDRKSVV